MRSVTRSGRSPSRSMCGLLTRSHTLSPPSASVPIVSANHRGSKPKNNIINLRENAGRDSPSRTYALKKFIKGRRTSAGRIYLTRLLGRIREPRMGSRFTPPSLSMPPPTDALSSIASTVVSTFRSERLQLHQSWYSRNLLPYQPEPLWEFVEWNIRTRFI